MSASGRYGLRAVVGWPSARMSLSNAERTLPRLGKYLHLASEEPSFRRLSKIPMELAAVSD